MATMTDDQFNFLSEWAELGGPVARKNNLPVSAMLACAAVESAWGKGSIFSQTLNPFSLQKWPHVFFPKTHRIYWHTTVIQTNPKKTKVAPFTCATDRADAVRQWCEWILHYGDANGPPGSQDPKARRVAIPSAIARRNQLLSYRHNPVEFARHLPLVGFGENQASGSIYAKRLTDFSMYSLD